MENHRLPFLLILGLLAACSKPNDAQPIAPLRHEQGAYILCEGNYGWGEGSVFYYDTSLAAQHQKDAYLAANGFTAGNVVESLTLSGDSAFLVVNNSNKVECLNRFTLQRLGLNSSLVSPRYGLPVGSQLWVTDLYANAISVLNRNSLTPTFSIRAKGWTEHLIAYQNKIYIANSRQTASSSGDLNEQILVLNPEQRKIVDSIKLGGQGARELVMQNEGVLVSALEKDFRYDEFPSIIWINLSTKGVTSLKADGAVKSQPFRIQVVGDYIFWLQGDAVRWVSVAMHEVKTIYPFGAGANLTSLAILRQNGNAFRILVASAGNYASEGVLKDGWVNATTAEATFLKETSVGIIPGQIVLF